MRANTELTHTHTHTHLYDKSFYPIGGGAFAIGVESKLGIKPHFEYLKSAYWAYGSVGRPIVLRYYAKQKRSLVEVLMLTNIPIPICRDSPETLFLQERLRAVAYGKDPLSLPVGDWEHVL